MTLYDMPITKTWLGRYYKEKDFDKAKCPICKHAMTYQHSTMTIEWACENKKCKGYFRWLGGHQKTTFGDVKAE